MSARVRRCARCSAPIPPGLRPEAIFCSKRCRQAASRARVRERPAAPERQRPELCAWCELPMPGGLRVEATFCSKRCRQASSRFGLAVARAADSSTNATGRGSSEGAGDRSRASTGATRRWRPAKRDCSRAMCFAYADPPYPGLARRYYDCDEVDHRELIARLMREFLDGWALSTSARALAQVLALCPPGVRVCSWHRLARPARSHRPISAWEPLIVCGGRELPSGIPQTVTDALAYAGRYRSFPGAITGMKPPQFAIWMFAQLGALPGDELVDLYPGSGAVGEAWRRYVDVDRATAHRKLAEASDTSPVAMARGDGSPTPAPAGDDASSSVRAAQAAQTPSGEVLSDASRGSPASWARHIVAAPVFARGADDASPGQPTAAVQPSPRELVLDALGERDRAILLAGGRPQHEHTCTSGPLRPAVSLTRRGLEVQRYTPVAWASQVAWHAYWRAHGYHTLDGDLRPSSPPPPRYEHSVERVTWAQAREWVRERDEAQQLQLQLPRASGPGDRSPVDGAAGSDVSRGAAARAQRSRVAA